MTVRPRWEGEGAPPPRTCTNREVTMHGIRHQPPGHEPPVNSPRFNKPRRAFGEPVAITKSRPRFLAPPFTNFQNLNLPLEVVLRDPMEHDRISKAKKVVFQ